MDPWRFLLSSLLLLVALCGSPSMAAAATAEAGARPGTIIFTTLGRSRYNFDIFSVPIAAATAATAAVSVDVAGQLQLTDGVSVNYNGFFPSSLSSALLPPSASSSSSPAVDSLLYVTERNGSCAIYLDLFSSSSSSSSAKSSRRAALELPTRVQLPLIPSAAAGGNDATNPRGAVLSMKDRPSLVSDRLVYVSDHEPASSPRQSAAAVYSTLLPAGPTLRLTPYGVADFSPAVSPSGEWTAVASSGDRGWSGEVEELDTSIYVFRTEDGSERTLVVEHGGWPCWGDESTLYFHHRSTDGWWSVYRATISIGANSVSLISVSRITPPGFHAFTPASSPGAPGLVAVATRRPTSDFRHIELVVVRDGDSNAYVEVTRGIAPRTHHFNPFISPDGARVGYHRCRGRKNGGSPSLLLENINSVDPDEFSLFRFDGSFPAFSPDGRHIAYVEMPGIYVVNSDGSGSPRKVFSDMSFPVAWDWKRKGVIYTSCGPTFAAESTELDILSISLPDRDHDGRGEDSEPVIKKLTTGRGNNAFPSPSPDGKWVVFRSGRSGHKNLYIMDAVEGESAGILQLTQGPWSDTMCNWSPDGNWIAFASDRDDPGSGSFAIYLVHPNGTGLRRLVHSGDGGRTNHPWFSPDSKSIVFTSDYGGVSAEPISNPHHYQPYGEIFTINLDGSGLRRLTYNSYEDGTPTWTPFFLKPVDVAESLEGSDVCSFEDCHWLNVQAKLRKPNVSATVG